MYPFININYALIWNKIDKINKNIDIKKIISTVNNKVSYLPNIFISLCPGAFTTNAFTLVIHFICFLLFLFFIIFILIILVSKRVNYIKCYKI